MTRRETLVRGVPPAMLAATAAVALSAAVRAVAVDPSRLRLGALVIMLAGTIEYLRARRIRIAFVARALVLALFGAPDAQAAVLATPVAPLPLFVLTAVAAGSTGMGDAKLASAAGAPAGLAAVTAL